MSLSDIDLTDIHVFQEGTPYHWFKELREKEPVYWHPEKDGPGFWCITKWDDLRHVSRNPLLFSSEVGGTMLRDMEAEQQQRAREMGQRFPIMLNMDPPQHVKFRRVVQRSFTPRYVDQQAGHIRDLASQIVDAAAPRGEVEFVEEVAAELPLQVICEMMAVDPEDRKDIFDLSNRMIGFDDPELGGQRDEQEQDQQTTQLQMFGHARKVAEKYRDEPGDNLTSKLLHHEIDGEKLNEIEYCAFFLLLCVAGNETTRTVTTNGMKQLIAHPDQLQLLVENPSLIPSAIEEIVRYDPAVHHFRRTAMQDTEIRDKQIRKGDKVVMWYPSANRDEEVFEDSDRFDVTRKENEHLAFGIGEHFCLGANLARLELQLIFEQIIPRLRNPEHAGPVRRMRSNFINGVKEMRIKFTPEQV